MRCGLTCYHKAWNLWCERGGGSKPQPPQIIPAPAAPSVADTAAQSAQAQLQYNPQLTQQALDLQRQFGGQFQQANLDQLALAAPQYRNILRQNLPQIGQFEDQLTQRFNSPMGYSAQQQQGVDAIRQRSRDALSKQVRGRANLGGNLFSGNAALQEGRALGEMEQGFAAQDIGYQQQQQSMNLQQLLALAQIAGLPAQQVNVPQFGQSVVPSGDNLYNALVQNQGNFGVMPGGSGGGGSTNPLTMWYNPKTYGF